MAIKIDSEKGVIGGRGLKPMMQEVEILADSEADIAALPAYGEPVTDMDGTAVIPAKGSVAYTADLAVGYMMSPSGVWTKFKG